MLVTADRQPDLLVRYEYDVQGRLVAAFDPAGNPLQYAYDEEHRLIQETNRLGGSFYFEYNWEGYCSRTWADGDYMERRLEYNKVNSLTRATDSLGRVTQYHLNDLGLVTLEVSPRGGRLSIQL